MLNMMTLVVSYAGDKAVFQKSTSSVLDLLLLWRWREVHSSFLPIVGSLNHGARLVLSEA